MDSSSCLTQMGVANALLLLALIAIGVIVFVCSLSALRQARILGSASRLIIAACVAIFGLFGLTYTSHAMKQPVNAEVGSLRDAIITESKLLFVSIALTLVVLLFAIALVSVWQWLSGRITGPATPGAEGPDSNS